MNSNVEPNQTVKSRPWEWVLSIIASLNCILVVIMFAITNSSGFSQGLVDQWPFPLIYFFEIATLGILGVVAIGNLHAQVKSRWSGVLWACAGILLAFVILGAWTIGFFLIPAMLLFLILGIITDRRTGGEIPLHIVYFVAAGVAQATFVLLTLFG